MIAVDARSDLINEIRSINHSVSGDYLRAFSYESLLEYLKHLQITTEPRDASSVWVRKSGKPAVCTRSRRDR